jgi:DNA-binding SARP family transcriptional activator
MAAHRGRESSLARGRGPGTLSVEVLNSFRLWRNRERLVLPPGSERLVAFLAINRQPTRRRFMASALWLDDREPRANAALRAAIWRLRLAAPDALVVDSTHVRLGERVWVDLYQAETLADRLIEGGQPPEIGGEQILSGDLLPDWYEEWIPALRERHRQLRVHALEAMCERLIELKKYGRAVQAALLALAAEPIRESANALLIRAYVAEGNRSQAVKQFEYFRRLLREELQLDPSPEMEELVRFSRVLP